MQRAATSALLKKSKKDALDDTATVCVDKEDMEMDMEEERAQIMALASTFPPNCHKQVCMHGH